jgi:glycosyltransferase involved in cell wall biosynthesis
MTGEGGEGTAYDRDAGVEVLSVPGPWTMPRLSRSVREVKRLGPDIVHMQFPAQGYGEYYAPWLLPLRLRLAGNRIVQTWHEYIPRALSLRPFAAALAAKEVIVVRPGYAKRIPWPHRTVMFGARVTTVPNASNIPPTSLSEESRRLLRDQLALRRGRLIGFFGFMYPHKRVESLFDLLDPSAVRLMLIGEIDRSIPYHRSIWERMQDPRWKDSVSCTGFVDAARAADLLAACDAIVLPFAGGGGEWNTSLHAARSQGTYVVTTSDSRRGYDADENVFYVAPDDIGGMKQALSRSEFPRRPAGASGMTWESVAGAHEDVYSRAMNRGKTGCRARGSSETPS